MSAHRKARRAGGYAPAEKASRGRKVAKPWLQQRKAARLAKMRAQGRQS